MRRVDRLLLLLLLPRTHHRRRLEEVAALLLVALEQQHVVDDFPLRLRMGRVRLVVLETVEVALGPPLLVLHVGPVLERDVEFAALALSRRLRVLLHRPIRREPDVLERRHVDRLRVDSTTDRRRDCDSNEEREIDKGDRRPLGPRHF